MSVDVTVGTNGPNRAFSFRLAVDYEVDGQLGVAVLDNRGQPFRVTGYHCPVDSVTTSNQPQGPLAKVDPVANCLDLS